MYHSVLIIVINFLLVTLANGLDCFTGRSGYGLLYTQCSPDVHYCAKTTSIDSVHGLVVDKGCDTENFCSTAHSGCIYSSYDKLEICCCTSNLCNGSKSYFYHSMLSLIVAIIFIAINL